MEVSKKLTIRPETVETIFDLYQEKKLLVNRRYQRKLVWTVEEKEKFIDSLSLNLPVPLILVAEVKFKQTNCLEIIDGMQRLDSIVTFIEGEFTLDGKYFDLETISSTKFLLDKGVLKQNKPKLSREFCKNITSYPIPLSVSSIEKDEVIDDIFKRINSNGRHLSSQEIRQAGADNAFGLLVRKISESIRGDVSTTDRLYLNNMKSISINNKALRYGINMGGIFWRKHNIVSNENIRQSRDEEMVAHLLSAILMNTPRPAATAKNLDNFYSSDIDKNKVMNNRIKKLGHDYIVQTFEAVYAEFRKTFESTQSSFYRILFHNDAKYVNRIFQSVFLAFYDLLVIEQKRITNYVKLAKAFEGVGDRYFDKTAEQLNLSKPREEAIGVIKGICDDFFVKRKETDPVLNNGVVKLENLLGASKTENTSYDFKIGLHRLDNQNTFDKKCLEKILKTLTAIVNAGKGSVGYVIIGVADSEKDKKRFESFYSTKSIPYKSFHITGLDKEVQKHESHEGYRRKIESIIKNINITPSSYKDQILRNIDYFKYYDKSIMIFRIESLDEPARFDSKYYERHGTDTTEISSDKEKEIWRRFL